MNLWEHVKKHMGPFLEGKSGESLPADCPVRNKLTLGLSILFIVEGADFTVPKKDLDSLCYLLIPSAGSPEALHNDLGPVLSMPQRYFPFISYLMCLGVSPACMFAHRVYAQCQWRLEEGVGSPGNGVTDSCEPPCGYWELNLGPL